MRSSASHTASTFATCGLILMAQYGSQGSCHHILVPDGKMMEKGGHVPFSLGEFLEIAQNNPIFPLLTRTLSVFTLTAGEAEEQGVWAVMCPHRPWGPVVVVLCNAQNQLLACLACPPRKVGITQ